MSSTITKDNPGEKILLMGNEAIARGAIEAGVKIAAAYPGTPSSEIGNTLANIAKGMDLYFEWSSNEKVALEVAFGASMCGQRAMASMKHVGVNVALDILNAISLRGVDGGLLLVSTDDPSQHSSRTEQDNRWLAKINEIPVLEPSTPQEAKDFVKYGLELSERIKSPVILRTVTRLSHMRSDVKLGPINQVDVKPEFNWQEFSYRVAGFEKLFRRHGERYDKLKHAQEEFEELDYNNLQLRGSEKIGVMAVGFAHTYVMDALEYLDQDGEIAYLKLATPHPLPEGLIGRMIKRVDKLAVFEEVDPFVELHIKAIAKDLNPGMKIIGRLNNFIPREGELSHEIVDDAIARLLGKEIESRDRSELEVEVDNLLFDRMLTLCAGCPHRATLYSLKRAVKRVKGELTSYVVNGDIGCYGLAHAPPMAFEDTYFCMGASLGVSQGMAKLGVETISWIGDGTFFHAGIPALINAVHKKAPIKVVVADNETIAMTGFQITPQNPLTAMGEPTKQIFIEEIAKACGVEHIEVVDAYNLKDTEEAFVNMLNHDGVAMVISRRLCATEAVRRMRPENLTPFQVDEEVCVGCQICLDSLGCPALEWRDDVEKAQINHTLCIGCGVCAQVCTTQAISRGEI
jgi:indolepyruvate ferredoxin oxidoreductase alpha subunit